MPLGLVIADLHGGCAAQSKVPRGPMEVGV